MPQLVPLNKVIFAFVIFSFVISSFVRLFISRILNSKLFISLIRNEITCKGFKSNVKHRKVFNKSRKVFKDKKVFKKPTLNLGINLDSIDILNKDILKNLYGYKLIGNSLFNLNPYSLFNTIYGTDNVDKLISIFEDLGSIISICEDNYSEQENIYLNSGIDIGKNINNIIALHNKNIIPAHGNLGLKKLIIANLNIITPGFTGDPFSTPLSTLDRNEGIGFNRTTAKFLYDDWLVSSYMLIWEFNILNQAKLYLENLYNSNPKQLSSEYKNAYILWQNRQFKIAGFNASNLKEYLFIDNYNEDIVMFREICEDLLYVQLNLILAVNIISYLHENKDNLNNNIYSDINNIFIDHIKKYCLAYSCLQELRVYIINKYNVKHLNLLYDKYFKQNIEDKKYSENFYKKFPYI